MSSTRSMSSYKSSNQSIRQKKKQTLKARSDNIWKYSNNPLDIKACRVRSIAHRAARIYSYCPRLRTIARKIERIRLIELASYFNESFKAPTLREMIHMTHINIVQNK